MSQTGPTWGPSGQAARGMASHAKCDRISLAEPAYMGGVPYKGRGVGAACMGLGRGCREGAVHSTPQARGNQNGTKTELKTDRGLEERVHKQCMPGSAWPCHHT